MRELHYIIVLCRGGTKFGDQQAAKWMAAAGQLHVCALENVRGQGLQKGVHQRGTTYDLQISFCHGVLQHNGPVSKKKCKFKEILNIFTISACRDCPNNRTACYERQCVTADGIERGIMTINRKMPGPSIQVSTSLK